MRKTNKKVEVDLNLSQTERMVAEVLSQHYDYDNLGQFFAGKLNHQRTISENDEDYLEYIFCLGGAVLDMINSAEDRLPLGTILWFMDIVCGIYTGFNDTDVLNNELDQRAKTLMVLDELHQNPIVIE